MINIAKSMEKKILAVYPYSPYPPNFGGRIRYFHLLELFRKLFKIEIAAFTTLKDDLEMLKKLEEIGGKIFKVPVIPQGHLTRWMKISNILSPIPWEIPIRSVQMERLVYERSAECDILFLHSSRLMHLRSFSRSQINIIDLADVAYAAVYRKIMHISNIKARIGYFLEFIKTFFYELKALAKFDMVLVTSDAEFHRLNKWNHNLPLKIIPNGVDAETLSFNDINMSQQKVLIFVGALDYEPNVIAVDWLCGSIFPKIRGFKPDAKLRLIGRNPSEKIQSYATQGGIELIANVPDVSPYLKNCGVMVVPLTMGGGTRLKILEAAAVGRPVVSTSLGAEGLGFTPGLEIEIADSEDEFVQKTVDLLSNSQKAREMTKLARQRVEKEFTWAHSKSKLETALSPWL